MHTIDDARLALRGIGLVEGLAAEQVDEHLGRYLRLHDLGHRGLAFYLAEVQERRLHQSFGYASTVEYARHRHGLTPRRTRELVLAGQRLRDLRLVDAAFCRQEITWTKVVLLLRVATPEHERAWLELATRLGVTRLKREVRLARPDGPPRAEDGRKGLPEVRFPLRASLGALPHEMLQLAQKKLGAERGRPVAVEEVIEVAVGLYLEMERAGRAEGWEHVPSSAYRIHLARSGGEEDAPLLVRTDEGAYPVDGVAAEGVVAAQRSACLACDGEHVADDGHATPDAPTPDAPTPPALRRRVLARDDHRCRCCGSRAGLHVHHLVFRSEGGPTRESNLLTLCVRCHALVHAGLLAVRGRHAREVRFTDRDGRDLHGPEGPVPAASLLRIEAPPPRPVAAASRLPEAASAELPDRVDTAWWRRNAHRIRCTADGPLQLRPGVPVPVADLSAERPVAERPSDGVVSLDELVGREDLLARLRAEAEGARVLGEPFPHTLLTGPPGAGKTSLAAALAASHGARLVRANGPLVKDVALLLRLVASLAEGDVLFVDEVHAVPRAVLEVLYQAMTERRLALTFQSTGARERSVSLVLPAFTVLAATTRPADLDPAFVSRFAVREHLEPLEEHALATLAASRLTERGIEATDDGARALASHARGSPRELLRLTDRTARLGAATGRRSLDAATVGEALDRLGYDRDGLLPVERRCLALLRASPQPVPERRLALLLGVDRRTLTDEIEPWLVQRGLVRITPRGRTPAATPWAVSRRGTRLHPDPRPAPPPAGGRSSRGAARARDWDRTGT